MSININQGLTKTEFYEEILSSLGGSLIDVELTEKDLDVCLRKAVRKFKQYGGNHYRTVFLKVEMKDAKDGVLNLPPQTDTVIRVVPFDGDGMLFSTGSGDDIYNQAIFEGIFGKGGMGGGIGSCYGCGGMGDLLLYELNKGLQNEFSKRFGSHGIDFVYDEFRKTIRILKGRNPFYVLECTYNLEDDEYRGIEWVIRWALSEAKMMLGMAYRKFGTVSAPTGEVSLAGSEYIQEAREEQSQLIEDANDFMSGANDYGVIMFG